MQYFDIPGPPSSDSVPTTGPSAYRSNSQLNPQKIVAPQRPKRPNLGNRRYSSASSKFDPRLGAIDEDGGMQPDPPPQAFQPLRRPLNRMLNFSIPLYSIHRSSPPPSYLENIIGPGGEKFTDVRNNKRARSRGGLNRLVFYIAIPLLCVVGLILGLVLGFRKHKQHKPPVSSGSVNQFPAGSYSIPTVLAAVDTSCTSNAATWRCYPYTSYSANDSSSRAASAATFSWSVISSGLSDSSYLISSAANPFAPTFINATLTTVDLGLDTEAYHFSIPKMQILVVPDIPLTDDGAADRCYYNQTMFEGWLYTKMAKTYPESPISDSETVNQPWPFAVKIQETITGGTGVPDCYKSVNGQDGSRVIIAPGSSNQACECGYQNFGT